MKIKGEDAGVAPHLQRLFEPLIFEARTRLLRQVDASLYCLLSPAAHIGWEQYLFKRLRITSARVVAHRCRQFQFARSLFHNGKDSLRLNQEFDYESFVGRHPAERLQKILSEFPGLARVVEVLIGNWVTTVSEFLERLHTDLAELPKNLSGAPTICPAKALHAGLSDPHQGGRCVVQIVFRGSTNLIYKPRSLAPEARFFSFLKQLNTWGIPYPFRNVRCWDRGDYGWMEHIASQPCTKPSDLRAFYWCAGALLALVYLLRGVDMHEGNLLASGAYPMLVDLETLWHPQEHIGMSDHATASTILRTGFLPLSDASLGATYTWSALCRHMDPTSQGSPHLPVLADTVYPASNFLSDILAGFRWIGRQVLTKRQRSNKFQLLAQTLARSRRRQILRSTSWYQSVIERVTSPSSFRDVAGFASECRDNNQGDVAMNEQERSALLRIDIPYFEQRTNTGTNEEVAVPLTDLANFERQEAIIVDALKVKDG